MENKIPILLFGKTWADLIFKDYLKSRNGPASYPYFPFHVASPNFVLSAADVKSLGGTDKDAEMLQIQSKQSSVLVEKFFWYSKHCVVAFIDVDALDTSIGHEIARNCYGMGKPVYGVGVNGSNSPLSAFYLKGIIYPRQTQDIYQMVPKPAPKEIKVTPPEKYPETVMPPEKYPETIKKWERVAGIETGDGGEGQ